MKTYNIDWTTKTITVSKAFLTKAGVMGTKEFDLMMKLNELDMEIVITSGNRKSIHRPTYKSILAYISRCVDGERYLAEFETVRAASLKEANPYLFVMDWYNRTFSNHSGIPEMDEENRIINFAA